MQQGMGQPQQPPPNPVMGDEMALTPDALAQQVNPAFLGQAAQLNDQGIFDASAISALSQASSLKDLVSQYLPTLEKSLDNVGRVLLTLWMDETRVKQEIGAESYIELENNLRTVFKGMGELILRVNQSSRVLPGKYDQAIKE